MDNQHRKIQGYKELDQETIDMMNAVKLQANATGAVLDSLEATGKLSGRWLSIARTQLQQGFMAATRAVAKPDFF